MFDISKTAEKLKDASYSLSNLNTEKKNEILNEFAKTFLQNADNILKANELDIKNAENNNLSEQLIERLTLTFERIKDIANGVMKVANLSDPIGDTISTNTLPNGLIISKVRVPIGRIGIIYEARPNVTCDAAALCFKSGNVCLLRGGKEAFNSNFELVRLMKEVLKSKCVNPDIISFVEDTSRETASKMMKLNGYLDVLIPRGGAGLIKSVVENSTVPVIETGTGNCHIYVDEYADIEKALKILINAKTQRTSVCNAVESLLVHKNIAEKFLTEAKYRLDEMSVEIRGCDNTLKYIDVSKADENDFAKEYLDLIISCKIVDSLDEAILHINKYGTGHSEAIITENDQNAEQFLQKVDAACVYHNASTRFTDGFEFGFGAEIGISTQKLHARGPMGLTELTSYKYIVRGNGQIRG